MEPRGGGPEGSIDAYEYTAHSHMYNSEGIPAGKFTYDLSPIQIVVRETGKAFYHFVTTTCAIVGGVFTATLSILLRKSILLLELKIA